MPATPSPIVAAGGYLVLKPVTTVHGQITGMKIDRVTQTYPQRLADGERAVPITVVVPKSVFQPLPSVFIDVPEGEVVAPQVRVG